MKILIIEDNVSTIETISLAFQVGWQEAEVIFSRLGKEGIALAESEKPDTIILDLGLPDISGFDVLKNIRTFSNVPVIVLTGSSEESAVVKTLEWGADEYIIKPFRQLELIARVRAIQRRTQLTGDEIHFEVGSYQFDVSTNTLKQGNKIIRLTNTESLILHSLLINKGQIVSTSGLAEKIWGENYFDSTDAVRVYIRHLRQKIETDPSNPKLILTKPGIGYFIK
jgi:DNA-binding response OmpR family regulator